MNKYEELLNAIRTNYGTHSEYYKTVKELVDQTKTPTLEEVKKEWEELGYFETEKGSKYSVIRNEELNKEFTIYHNDKTYDCTKAHFNDITIKEHNLLTKTFRALGWEI